MQKPITGAGHQADVTSSQRDFKTNRKTKDFKPNIFSKSHEI